MKNFFAAGPQTPPASKLNGTNLTLCTDSSCRLAIASPQDEFFSASPCSAPQPSCRYAVYPVGPLLIEFQYIRASSTYSVPVFGLTHVTSGTRREPSFPNAKFTLDLSNVWVVPGRGPRTGNDQPGITSCDTPTDRGPRAVLCQQVLVAGSIPHVPAQQLCHTGRWH